MSTLDWLTPVERWKDEGGGSLNRVSAANLLTGYPWISIHRQQTPGRVTITTPRTPPISTVGTTPPAIDVGSNAPPPQVPADWGPLPGSGGGYFPDRIHTGPINPRGRRRPLPTYRTFEECIDADPTDSGVLECAEKFGRPTEFDEPMVGYYSPPVQFPIPIIGPFIIADALGVLAGFPVAAGLLWPRAAGRGSDLRDLYPAVPAPSARPAGPGRRGRRRPITPPPGTVPRPSALPRPAARPRSSGPVTISAPRTQAPAVVRTGEIQAPRPASLPAAVEIQVGDIISSAPGTGEIASPAAAPAIPAAAPSILSRVGQWAANIAPFLPLALPFTGALSSPSFAPRTQAATYPLTGAQPSALTSPSVAALPQSDRCSTARTRQRKRRKKPCINPTVSSRIETRGSKRYQITKRWLKCPASSRRKRALRRVV